MRLGLEKALELPHQCPDCGDNNSLDHALSSCRKGGVQIRRHDEMTDTVEREANRAGFWVPSRREPCVGPLSPEDPRNRCDTVIHGLKNPQRDAWIDVAVVDTGAPSHVRQQSAKTLGDEENNKLKKHRDRVVYVEGSDFLPVVLSVYGSLAFSAHEFLYKCAEKTAGRGGKKSRDFGRLLHLLRARWQAATHNAVSLCLWGRRGKWAKDAKRAEELKMQAAEGAFDIPWECMVADAMR